MGMLGQVKEFMMGHCESKGCCFGGREGGGEGVVCQGCWDGLEFNCDGMRREMLEVRVNGGLGGRVGIRVVGSGEEEGNPFGDEVRGGGNTGSSAISSARPRRSCPAVGVARRERDDGEGKQREGNPFDDEHSFDDDVRRGNTGSGITATPDPRPRSRPRQTRPAAGVARYERNEDLFSGDTSLVLDGYSPFDL